MREIKKLKKDQLKLALKVAANSYPSIGLYNDEKIEEYENIILKDFDNPGREWYSLFDDGQLIGNMVLYNFDINYYDQQIKGKGIGFVATDLLQKKKAVCKDMLSYYLQLAQKEKKEMALLFSFRPDFYHKMGFGFGTRCFNYKFKPTDFPTCKTNYTRQYLNQEHKNELMDFYHHLFLNKHGIIPKTEREISNMFTGKNVVIGFRENEKLKGILTFYFTTDPNNHEETDMHLWISYAEPDALREISSFLNSQADQVRYIHLYSQDEDFYFLMDDIRHKNLKLLQQPGFHFISEQGMGILYKSLNSSQLIIKRPCSLSKTKIRFILNDDFAQEKNGDFIIEWNEGEAKISKGKKSDLTLEMKVSDFSSWIMNAINLKKLSEYGLLTCSHPDRIPELDRAFYHPDKPVCYTRF